MLVPRQCIRNFSLTLSSGAILDVFNKIHFSKKENKKIMLYRELKFISILSRLSDFTLGVGIDVYFPLKAGKEKGIYNRK